MRHTGDSRRNRDIASRRRLRQNPWGESRLYRENVLRRRIGSTSYIISVHFAETCGETIEERLIRLIESEVAKSA